MVIESQTFGKTQGADKIIIVVASINSFSGSLWCVRESAIYIQED